MSWNHWIRQSHRWLSIAFIATVVANILARIADSKEPSSWITFSPLLPLFLMMVTGLYLFALPYIAKRESRSSA